MATIVTNSGLNELLKSPKHAHMEKVQFLSLILILKSL